MTEQLAFAMQSLPLVEIHPGRVRSDDSADDALPGVAAIVPTASILSNGESLVASGQPPGRPTDEADSDNEDEGDDEQDEEDGDEEEEDEDGEEEDEEEDDDDEEEDDEKDDDAPRGRRR